MPRSPSTYSLPPGTTPQVPNTVISSSMFTAFADDVAQTFNTVQPIVYGGTGSNDLKLTDTDFGIKDNSDPTKIGQFNASGLPTATTRTYDLPYYSGTLGLVSDIRGYRFGLNPTRNVTDAANDIDIAAGSAVDSLGSVSMLLAASITKRIDASWAVGSGNGGLDTGVVGNGTYYIWLIRRPDTGVVDALFSLSSTTPLLPTNYTQSALIGSLLRTGGANAATYLPNEGFWNPILLISNSDTGITYSSQVGSYSKNGHRVSAAFQITLSSKGANTGNVTISNLPFISAGSMPNFPMTFGYWDGIVGSLVLGGALPSGVFTANVFKLPGATLTGPDITNSFFINGVIEYDTTS